MSTYALTMYRHKANLEGKDYKIGTLLLKGNILEN